jgi:pantothenate kinase
VAELGTVARLVPMDGFHLAQSELVRLGRRDRMGAPDTFDAAGYAALLQRLKGDEPVVYAPEFRREIEEPIAGAIAIPREVPLVVTEGNYLLLWPDVQPLLDECWYVETDEELRVQRLIQRHIQFGKTPEYARAWVLRSDEHNAKLVAETAGRADALVRL